MFIFYDWLNSVHIYLIKIENTFFMLVKLANHDSIK